MLRDATHGHDVIPQPADAWKRATDDEHPPVPMELLVIGPHRPGLEPPGPAQKDPPAAVHVRAEGELDLWTGPELADRLALAADAGTGVVLDLRDATFADCSTVALVSRVARRAEAEGWTLRILPGPPAAQRVFALTGTLETLPFAATDEGARP